MCFHPRHVRITEERQAVGLKRQYFCHAVANCAFRLAGQAIHEVKVDTANAGGAKTPHDAFGHVERLNAVDGALHGGIEVLNSQTNPRDAKRGE